MKGNAAQPSGEQLCVNVSLDQRWLLVCRNTECLNTCQAIIHCVAGHLSGRGCDIVIQQRESIGYLGFLIKRTQSGKPCLEECTIADKLPPPPYGLQAIPRPA
jgi:hypothetical protein